MDTVLWALGVVCTIAVFIAGFGWWSNFKVYENDKKRLKEELDLSLAERIAQLELRLTSSNADFTRVIEARVEAMLNRAYAEQTALQAKINELATKLEELSKRLVAAKKDNLQVNAALRRVEETVWDIRDIPENILVTQSQGLEAELEADLISNAKWTLERMKKVLEKSFINGNEHMSRGTIEILLDALPTNISELGVELTAVRSLLERVNVVEDVET
jgi:predicted nuclease with TOPRIM domain